MDNHARIERMKILLTDALDPTQLDIIDDSHKHIGHPGAQSGAGHFTVRITSSKFEKISLIAAHRLVYQALGDMMKTEIHALRIEIL